MPLYPAREPEQIRRLPYGHPDRLRITYQLARKQLGAAIITLFIVLLFLLICPDEHRAAIWYYTAPLITLDAAFFTLYFSKRTDEEWRAGRVLRSWDRDLRRGRVRYGPNYWPSFPPPMVAPRPAPPPLSFDKLTRVRAFIPLATICLVIVFAIGAMTSTIVEATGQDFWWNIGAFAFPVGILNLYWLLSMLTCPEWTNRKAMRAEQLSQPPF